MIDYKRDLETIYDLFLDLENHTFVKSYIVKFGCSFTWTGSGSIRQFRLIDSMGDGIGIAWGESIKFIKHMGETDESDEDNKVYFFTIEIDLKDQKSSKEIEEMSNLFKEIRNNSKRIESLCGVDLINMKSLCAKKWHFLLDKSSIETKRPQKSFSVPYSWIDEEINLPYSVVQNSSLMSICFAK